MLFYATSTDVNLKDPKKKFFSTCIFLPTAFTTRCRSRDVLFEWLQLLLQNNAALSFQQLLPLS